MLIIAYIGALTAPMNMMKVPAVAPALMPALGIDTGGIGLLMSAYTLTGVIFALPAGAIARKFGYKNAGLLALAISLIGDVVSCFAMDFGLMMFARVLEGIGLCMLNIIVVSTAYAWFPPEKRGVAVGFSCTNVALAACVGQPILAAIGDAFGYIATWWFAAAFNLLGLLLFLFFKNPPFTDEENKLSKVPMFKIIGQHKQIILLFVLFTLHNFCIMGYLNSFTSTYLVEGFGLNMGAASLYMAGAALCTCIFMPIVGKIADRYGRRKPLLIVGAVSGLILGILFFSVPNLVFIAVLCVLIGLESACIVSTSQGVGPMILGDPELASVSSSFFTFGQNIGQFVGPTVFGMAIAAIGWQSTAWFIMVPAFLINLVIAALVKIK